MKILYDMQTDFNAVKLGEFERHGAVSLRRDPSASGRIKEIEDIKSLLVSKRTTRESGIYIHINEIDGLLAGDRITITGRISKEHLRIGSNWSIALLSGEDGHLTHSIAPGVIYSLSYILGERDIKNVLTVHTVGWGLLPPLMDFFVDDIVISRNESEDESDLDSRNILYSLANDLNLHLINAPNQETYGTDIKISSSGGPNINVIQHNGSNAVALSTRVNDWDGVDIMLSHLNLRAGNTYKIIVRGRVDGKAPDGTEIMLQGIPSFSWRCINPVQDDEDFTLEYILTRSEVATWNKARITTNTNGATMSFVLYDIEVERV